MFFISTAVWFLILLYLYYTNTRLKKLEREARSLKEE
ncbi:MAG: CcmD family protein [Candidatus Hodarchaeota archaeon]